ncbi:hypothetical protein DL546_000802 [Coniochaeta pulveracea]|uniref:Prp 4 CRoW domain-containing protein n=1 Tax=Coniochaeta pulveracea TaxID=177199 RepID=A0A420Y2R0_9PEZI|nr:hypothetical protein DL546_000802 [Coniochaeta pulveracea]
MLFKSVSTMAVVALAAGVSAEDLKPYKPLMKMSIHQMFGIGRRQTDGYQPTESTCSDGATCAEACGAGYVTCASVDQNVHCFNPDIKQTCCPDQTGNSCDAGYYCTADTKGQTWCCPDAMDLVACAAAYSVTGGLVSETAAATSTSASSSSTTSSSSTPLITTTSSSTSVTTITTPSSTSTLSSSSSVSSSSWAVQNATITTTSTGTITSCTSTIGSSATFVGSNSTTAFVSASPSPTTSPVPVSLSGAATTGPALLSLLAAAALAALL